MSYAAVGWCSWEEVSSVCSYVTIMNQNPINKDMFLISKVFLKCLLYTYYLLYSHLVK